MAVHRILESVIDCIGDSAAETLPDQRALNDIKYDPMLPPLPLAASRVLQRVERDRSYAEFRLAMLEQEERTE